MISTQTIDSSYLNVMETTGFYRNGMPTPGVFSRESLENNLEKSIKYHTAIETLEVTAIYELSGSPCIYFTQLDQVEPNPEKLADLHKLAWNNGFAPLLWVITPTTVLLYNCFSKPSLEDQTDSKKHLIQLFETFDQGLQKLKENAHRLQFESGAFWQWLKEKKISLAQRVDKVLVADLTDTEQILVNDQKLDRSVAQALLIQSIFIAYLEDREILTPDFFKREFNINGFKEILDDKKKLEKLFDWIKVTFNGDLFPLSKSKINLIKPEHLSLVKDFIGGKQEIKTRQGRLWTMYDFKVIPIELISSIYENFIYAEDSKTAKENSTHYTPINLVDLVLSEVFKELNGTAKVLDLSCGSGVFLVESLRRLIVKRWMSGEERSRKLIRDTLYQQIYGVDINPKAIQIAAFSLYLTALELDYELAQNPTISDDLKFESIIGKNLFASDAFDESAEFNQQAPFINKQFDAVVGNPPWTKSKNIESAIKYCRKKEYPTAYGTPPDQAFWWRMKDFIHGNTIIGIIVDGQHFFSNNAKAIDAKKEFFVQFKVQILINLSKLRNQNIFLESTKPALIVIAKGIKPKQDDICYFVCPDRSSDYKEHGIIEIGAENIKKLSVFEIAYDSDILKIATWGNARDKYLMKRFKASYLLIEKIAGNSPKNGMKIGSNGNRKALPDFFKKTKILTSNAIFKYQIDFESLDILGKQKIDSPRDSKIYKSPLIIIPENLKSSSVFSVFSNHDILYDNSYSGIATHYNYIAHYLNGIINSSVASYFLFMTASSWGIEREKVMTQDLVRLTIPDPNELESEKLHNLLEIEAKLRRCNDEFEEKMLKQQLDKTVFDIYDLNQQERILVEDMTQITIDWFMKEEKSKAIRKPNNSQLEDYAKSLISVIQPFLNTLNERKIVAEIFDAGKAPLQVIKFSIISTSSSKNTVEKISVQELEPLLKSIAQKLPEQIADRIYTKRNVRIYLENEVYIVKPAKLIHWSRSAGLNDADIILAEHLGV